jgi:RNA polymerase sigma factor for flagellar operon FliA
MTKLLTKDERSRLVEEHLGYVRFVAVRTMRTLHGRLDLDELVALGNVGLVEAASRFDPNRGVAFTTFATYRIRGAILDGLQQQRGRGPRNRRFLVGANAYLQQRCQDEPAEAGCTEQRVRELEQTLGDLAWIFLRVEVDELPDASAVDGLEALVRKEAREALRRALERLPAPELRVLDLCYGHDLTFQAAGDAMGLSRSWACRLHTRALRRLERQLGHLAA